jgi:hypothetical protein
MHSTQIILKENIEPSTKFNTGKIFFPFAELLLCNETAVVSLELPIKFPAKTDIIVGAVGLTGFVGPVSCIMRGWIE